MTLGLQETMRVSHARTKDEPSEPLPQWDPALGKFLERAEKTWSIEQHWDGNAILYAMERAPLPWAETRKGTFLQSQESSKQEFEPPVDWSRVADALVSAAR